VLVLVALVGAVQAAPAAAAPYTVWSCRDAQGAPLSTAAWIPAGNAGTRADSCGAGGALSVALGAADVAPGAISGYRFDRPAGVTITRYTAWLAAETAADPPSQARYVAGLGQGDELSVPTVLDGCSNNAPTCSSGTFAEPLDPANEHSLSVLLGGLAFMAACASATDACVPAGDPPARAALFRSAVELDDPSAPVVDRLAGTAATAAPISGTRTIVAGVRDEGSGVRRTELLLDGAVVERQDGGGRCAAPYAVADPCPRNERATFVLDLTRLREGRHSVAVRAYDAAMNSVAGAPIAITVDHPAPAPPPDATPAPAALRLRVPDRVRLPTSRPVIGTVTAADGTPRANVRVSFEQRPFGGTEDEWRAMRATAISDAAGRFQMPRPAASAQIRALVSSPAFAATPAITGFVGRLNARISAADRTLRNGQRLTLRGRLRNAGGAAAGRTVLIQSRVRGRWRTVDSVESAAGGRIMWRYRFTSTDRTARYRFRFVVPRTRGLPWKRLTTRQVGVLVRAA
jgi:hypothetical protein